MKHITSIFKITFISLCTRFPSLFGAQPYVYLLIHWEKDQFLRLRSHSLRVDLSSNVLEKKELTSPDIIKPEFGAQALGK